MLNPCKISSHPIHSMQSSHKSIRIVNIKIKRTIARDMTKKTDLKNKEFKAVFLIKDETSLLTNEKKCFIV